MAFDRTTAIVSDLAGRVLASSLGSIASCAGGTVALLAWSPPTNHPCCRYMRRHRTLSGDARTSCSAKAEPRRSEGSLPSGADHRATPLYAVGPQGPDHDAVMRIGGEAPGGGPILENGVKPWP